MNLRLAAVILAALTCVPRSAECLSIARVELVTPFGEHGRPFGSAPALTSPFAGVYGTDIVTGRVVLPDGASLALVEVASRTWVAASAAPWQTGVYRFRLNEGLADAFEFDVPYAVVAFPALPLPAGWRISPVPSPFGNAYVLDLSWDDCPLCAANEVVRDLLSASGPITEPPPVKGFLLACPVEGTSGRCELFEATWALTIRRTISSVVVDSPGFGVFSGASSIVRFQVAVPEPGSGATALLGVCASACLALWRRRA